jgi:hypothetical protein
MLANFLGVLPILTPPLCALDFVMCSKSNPLVVFALEGDQGLRHVGRGS